MSRSRGWPTLGAWGVLGGAAVVAVAIVLCGDDERGLWFLAAALAMRAFRGLLIRR